jgi:hypothetical protein
MYAIERAHLTPSFTVVRPDSFVPFGLEKHCN